MRLHICAAGRLRAGPEKSLIDDYLARFDRTGRALGLGPARVVEIEDKKNGGMAAEAALLRKALPKGAVICTLDERGKVISSPDFADKLAGWRDSGRQDLALIIGGASRGGFFNLVWQDGLAAYAGAGDAGRADLPRRNYFGRQPLSPGMRRPARSECACGACLRREYF